MKIVERLRGRAHFCKDRGEEKTPSLLCEAADEIERLRKLVEEAYREGFSHGESAACAYEWGARADEYKTWENSDVRAEMSASL